MRILKTPAVLTIMALLPCSPTLAQLRGNPSPSVTVSTAPVGAEQSEDQEALIQTAEAGLAQDAAEYAKLVGVGVAEASRRLKAMHDSVEVTDTIRKTYGSRLAGISIEHKPQFQIKVLLTGADPVTAELPNVGVPIVFETGARSTLEQVAAAIEQHKGAIRTLIPAVQGIGADPKTGSMVVFANATGPIAATLTARTAELEALTGVPVIIRAQDGVDRDLDVRGGSRVDGIIPNDGRRGLCTSGFSVKDTNGRTGVATAAHCLDNLTYYNPNNTQIPLTLVTPNYGYGSQDVQIHTSNYVERAEFYVDTAKTTVRRPVGSYTRSATRAGDWACHRGETTGASCSFVEYIYYAPPDDKCAGYCAPTWVTVTGPNCAGGDSGGPVYDLDLARGLLKGANYSSNNTCNFYFYMSLDFLPNEWSLLLG